MSNKGIGYAGALSAGIFASLIAVFPQIWIAKSSLESKIDQLTPVVREEQVLGNQTPEKFYEIEGNRVYLEIDGKPVEQYFTDKTQIE